MISPFALLGLDGDADEAQVKRAYAKQLRATRPDDDPASFQRLNEAYQAALHFCRLRADLAGSPEVLDPLNAESEAEVGPASVGPRDVPSQSQVQPAPLAAGAPTQVPAAPPLIHEDPADTLDTILRTLPSLQAPTSWLRTYEPLYSLAHQRAVARLLVSRLETDDTITLPNHCLDALFAFFDIRQGMHFQQKIEARNAIRRGNTTAFGEHNPLLIQQFKRKLGPRSLLLACVPCIPERATRLGMRLQHGLGYWPAELDAAQMRLFTSLARPDYWGVWRWATVALAALTMGLAWGAPLALLSLGDTSWQLYLLVPAVTTGALLAWHGYGWLQYLIRRGQESNRWFLSQLPASLALVSLLLGPSMARASQLHGSGLTGNVAAPLVAAISITAALLVWRLKFTAVRFVLGGFMIHSGLHLDGYILSPYVFGPAMGPLGLLLFDALYARTQRIPLVAASGNRLTQAASYVALLCGFGAVAGSYKVFLGALMIGSIAILVSRQR
ncbi:J domain-containing protein [Pseudoxanthomonas koreensis]|uniref:J domain-containing protein n=1 Tax=Pseudoxanthomonas koreensis TaxID=266061 RepID=UPI0035A6407E